MTPQDFIRKWKPVALTERATAQEHFIDLCRLFDHPTPVEDDPIGEHFTFEKGAPKTGGGDGFADVWKKGFFAWEYKKKKRDLDKALEQLTRYAAALENPPLHVACDTHSSASRRAGPTRFRRNTSSNSTISPTRTISRACAPSFTIRKSCARAARAQKLTKEAADKFQTISDSLQHRNPDREAVAHFVNQLVFCFFADSVELLPERLVEEAAASRRAQARSARRRILTRLFDDMAKGGDFDLEDILEFNGGLFDGRPPLALEHAEIGLLFAAASLDWSLIDPTIFGTLFERFLDPDKRAQIGAHYTDPDKIMMIVEPVVAAPAARRMGRGEGERSRRSWRRRSTRPAAAADGERGARARQFEAARAQGRGGARRLHRPALRACAFSTRPAAPAISSISRLQAVKDIEYRAILECETLGLGMTVPRVGPEILHGIEINPFAAELARTTIWIGDIQWRVKNAIHHHPRPILRKLDFDRMPRRAADAGRQGRLRRGGMAGGGFHRRQPAIPGRQAAAARAWRRLCRGAVRRLRGPRSGRGRSRLLLVRQGVGRRSGGPREARRPRRDQFDSRRRQPQGAGADRRGRRDLRGVERRGVDGRRRGGAGVAGVFRRVRVTEKARLDGAIVVGINSDLTCGRKSTTGNRPCRKCEACIEGMQNTDLRYSPVTLREVG